MITIKEMYNTYITNVNDNISKYEKLIKDFTNSQTYFLGKLDKVYIENFTSIEYDKLNLLKVNITLEDKVFIIPATTESEIANRIQFVTNINNLSNINIRLFKAQLELNNLNKKIKVFKVYAFVLNNFNKLISNEILKGESFNLGYRLGTIRIQKKKRYKGSEKVESFDPHNYKVVNWGESNKLRKEIEAKGLIPYKSIKDENGKIIGNNGGVEWMIYFTDDFSYWWYWQKFVEGNKRLNAAVTNINKYCFSPTKGIIGNRVKLQQLLKTNPHAHLNFQV